MTKEYTLSVDCCSAWTTLGLAEGETVRGEINIDAGKNQSALLPGLLQHFLKAFSLTPENLSLFSVVTGPGSFTGIKVGIAFVSFLAWAGGKSIVPLSSLECMAYQKIKRKGGLAASVLWGGGGKIYGSLFKGEGDGLPPVHILRSGSYTPEAFLEAFSMTKLRHQDVFWLTDAPERVAPLFPSFAESFEKIIPTGSATVELTRRHKDRAVFASDIHADYFRDPDLG